jgi:hypothetical protein
MNKKVVFIKSTNENNNSFVGFKIINNVPHFFYPYYFYMPEENYQMLKEARKILKVIFLTKKTLDSSKLYSGFKSDNEFSFESFYFLIDHYERHKQYTNLEKEFTANTNGKIDWKKTLKTTSYLTENGFLFTKIFTSNLKQNDNLLTEAYRYAVSNSIDSIGWIFGIKNNLSFNARRPKSIYLAAINKELKSTFNENKRILLIHIKKALRGLDKDEKSSNLIFGIDSFNVVFEEMIDHIFSNVSNTSDYYPSASWIINEQETPTSKLRPDTIIENQNEIVIIDSKYYGESENEKLKLPQSGDIQKQITYEEFIKNYLSKNKKIYNLFMLPMNPKSSYHFSDLKNEAINFISYYGYAISKWKSKSNKIHGLRINLNKLVDDYIQNDKSLNHSLFDVLYSINLN